MTGPNTPAILCLHYQRTDSLSSSSPLMGLTAEEELADLFGDVLRLTGLAEKGKFPALSISQHHTNLPAAKSALRNFLHDKKIAPPLTVVSTTVRAQTIPTHRGSYQSIPHPRFQQS